MSPVSPVGASASAADAGGQSDSPTHDHTGTCRVFQKDLVQTIVSQAADDSPLTLRPGATVQLGDKRSPRGKHNRGNKRTEIMNKLADLRAKDQRHIKEAVGVLVVARCIFEEAV